jgi:ABC-type sugar transport system permease subunit
MSKGFRLIYYIPSIVGGVVFSVVMKEMYSYDGIVLKILKELGVELEPLVIKNGLLGHVSTAFPTMMIQTLILSMAGGNMIMAGAYMRIPEEIFESAQLEGCGFFRETFQIAVPCAWPTLSTMTIFALCGIFTADCSMYLYSDGTGKFGMTSIGYYLYRYNVALTQTSSGDHIYGYISAFGVLGEGASMGNPALLAGSIAEALVTTASGLAISIPALIFHNYFVAKVDKILSEIDASVTELQLQFLKKDS